MRKIILAIDFNNFVFKSIYGEPLINSKGNSVHAIKGALFRLRSLKDNLNPDYIVFANDLSRSETFRRKLYKEYKAQRKEKEPEIIYQMEQTKLILEALGFPFISHIHYEADDILGMISRLAGEHDLDVFIVSSDKDLYQLLDDHTYIISEKNSSILDTMWLDENYHLTPQQWIELKILQGDRSDNIPGIPGIGEVTALKLLQNHKSIETIYRHLGYLKPKTKELLINGKRHIDLTRELVTIVTDYHRIGLTMDCLDRSTIQHSKVLDMVNELEISSVIPALNYSLFHKKI